tara:strand:- start:792 stop:1664 length:873 start_codon:yes stop_codon:yes gene_type:complete
LILYICRSLSWICVIVVTILVTIGDSGPSSLKSDLEKITNEHDQLLIQLELDKNESDKELSIVFRSRVDFRNKEEEQESKISKLKQEVDGVSKKIADLNKKNEIKETELKSVKEKLSNASVPIVEIENKSRPLLEKKKKLEEEMLELNKNLASIKSETDKVQSKFKSLENLRNLAKDNFKEEQDRLMEVIKKPYNIYFGDSVSIEVANRAPSGKGFFINQGYEDGFLDGMEFLTKNNSASSNLPFRLKASLVQKNFSFLEFSSEKQVKDSSFADEGQLLVIERSGVLKDK